MKHSYAIAVLVLVSGALTADAQTPSTTPATPSAGAARPHVTFDFSRKGLSVPKYQLTLFSDGTGSYQGEQVSWGGGSSTEATGAPQEFRAPVAISAATATKVFTLSQHLNHFNKVCASKAKNIADTGTKVLSYAGPDGSGSCTYNYSENKDVEALTDIFQGIAETMDQGRELDRLHRYDRLGLDAAMEFLSQEVSQGRAIEPGTIAASLRSIAGDSDLLERVRTRASALLAMAPAESTAR